MARPPQRRAATTPVDPHAALLRALVHEHRRLTSEHDPELASTILDLVLHLRLLADLHIEPDHLATILRSDAPWTTTRAIARDLQLHTLGPVPIDLPRFLDLCRRLAPTGDPLPIELPGRVHERTLGGPDPGPRKRAGVFYTPAPIARLLVETTLAPLLADKSPEQLDRLRILDPACGSGCFLLAAYEALLAAHTRWYAEHPEQARRDGCTLRADGSPSLPLARRAAILAANIFGSDIDVNAVDLASRALNLRLLAGHPGYREPRPSPNLRCLDALHPGALERRFAAVFAAGGFDAVLGNPPFVRPHNLDPEEKLHYRATYSAFKAKADLYVCFMQRAADLLRPGGRLGLVVARGWLALASFDALRRHILATYKVLRLIELPTRAFVGAQVETHALVFTREPAAAARDSNLVAVDTLVGEHITPVRTVPQSAFATTHANVFDLSIEPATEAVKAIIRQGPTLGSLYDVVFGLKTGDDRKFLHRRASRHKDDRPLLRGEDVRRYGHTWTGEYVRYLPAKMRAHRSTARPGEPARFEQPKLLVKDTSKDLGATFDDGTHYAKDVLLVLPREQPAPALKALLAVLNSQALRFYYRGTFPTLHVQSKELASLPLPRFDLATRTGRAAHDRLVALVDRRLALEARPAPRSPADTRAIQTLERRIDALVEAQYGLTGPMPWPRT